MFLKEQTRRVLRLKEAILDRSDIKKKTFFMIVRLKRNELYIVVFAVPGLPAANYGMLAGSSSMLNPYQGMLPGQDLSHMGMPPGFDLSAYNPQLVSASQTVRKFVSEIFLYTALTSEFHTISFQMAQYQANLDSDK